MSQAQWIILAFKVALPAGIASTALFVGTYTFLAAWHRDPVGRTVVILDILLACALVPTTLSLYFSFSRLTSHIAAWFDVGLFGLISVGMLQRIPTWVRLHRTGGHRTYRGLLPFAAEVIRRRGRPVWADPPPEPGPEDGENDEEETPAAGTSGGAAQ